jgi:hypothetical protein
MSGEYGLGEGARATLRAIEAADIPFALKDIKVDWHRNLDATYTNFSEENHIQLTWFILCLKPDC